MRTKIIATIGPASASREMLVRLVGAGASVFRLNFSHGDAEFFRSLVGNIRSVEKELGRPLSILQDLAGPKIRLGAIASGAIEVARSDTVLLGSPEEAAPDLPLLPLDNPELLAELSAGDVLVLADGGLRFVVCGRVADNLVRLEAMGSGIVTSRKGIALPGKTLSLPALTDKDRADLALGLELGVDAVAVSFVQSASDIRQVRALLHGAKRSIPVVAKLERRSAIDDLNAIIECSDMIMVARGDLGVECPLPELPALQKRIIRACNLASKPVIVATQMLLSMVSSPSPTRAETTDVANAVLDGADCVMLSEETAMGAYPAETVEYMNRIASEAEEYLLESRSLASPDSASGAPEFLAYAACLLADRTDAAAIAAHTLSGSSARLLSACRPRQPIHALTVNNAVLHALNFSWGVLPRLVEEDPEVGHLVRVQRFIATNPEFPVGCDVVITAGEPAVGQPDRGTNLVKIYRK